MAMFQDLNGERHQVTVEPSIYAQAAENGLSVEALINQTYPTAQGEASAFRQICASEGIYVGRDREFGVRPATMDAILNGTPRMEAGSIVRDANPVSRILFPAVILSVLEDKLVPDRSMTPNAFDQMIAVDDSINHDRFERPILNFDRPEAARSKAIAQLSEPTAMLTITASDKSQRITGTSIGLEIADQAVKATSLDLVTLAMNRQAEVELAERVDGYILSFLNGDLDLGTSSMASLGKVRTATSFHAAINNTAGLLTQEAWVRYLFNNSKRRTIDYVITDIAGALAIENRTGRPTVQGDNATSRRIDTMSNVINPMWPDEVKVFITTDPNWPANTIMGIDSRYAIHRVTSTSIAYQAAEAYAMRRSTKFRTDVGQIAYVLFNDAVDVLTLV